MPQFKLNASEFEWITGLQDDPEDLCLHGKVTVIIGSETIETACTVSAAALYLLKSLSEDRDFGQDNQLFPCCGHFLIPNADLSAVTIIGCDTGADLKITHESGTVRIVTESGRETAVPYGKYRAEVLAFADQVKAFYDSCSPKKVPED